MSSMQIVFLFDLNAFDDILSKPREALSKRLLYMRLACLRLLTEFSTKTSNLRWGFKFFDSLGSVTQTMYKFSFSDLSLEAFETLENEICIRYERRVSYTQALAESSLNNINLIASSSNCSQSEKHQIAPVKILHLALTQILSEFQWEYIDMWSPSSKKFKDDAFNMRKRNILILFGGLTDRDSILLKYFGIDSLPVKSKFINLILPQTLREKLLDKADIHLVWLNVSQDQKFLDTTSSRTMRLLSETLQSIQGSLIPLSLLSQPLHHTKLLNFNEGTLFKNMSPTLNLIGGLNNSLLPFSSIILQSLYRPFYSNTNSSYICNLSFVCNGTEIPVQVIKILNRLKYDSSKEDSVEDEKDQSSSKNKFLNDTTIKWSKIVTQGSVSKSIKFVADEILLCLPKNSKSEICTAESFIAINKTLCLKGINLVLTCITDSGFQMPGLFIPLSEEAAVISILNPLIHLMHDIKMFGKESLEDANEELENAFQDIQSFKTDIKTFCTDSPVNCSIDSMMKQFQMESLELWFKPTSAISDFDSFVQSKSTNSSKIQSFHKLLQQSVRNKNTLQSELSQENVTHAASGIELHTESQTKENDELLVDLNLDQLLSTAKEIYNSGIEPSASVLDCAKKIVRLVSNYYKRHGGSSFEENVQNFMKDNFFLSVRRISEKYEMMQSEEDTNQKIKECQIQVLLVLEIEALTLPPDKLECVKTVTALLRMMSFYSGALQLNKLLCDILRDNYSHKLHDVLVDIGDELDMPIFGETESSDSPDIMSSELMDGELFGSAISSNMSVRSSSSTCSRKDNNRKLVRHRSDISDTTKSRQVLLPGTSPKKKKGKSCAQKKPVRCSPRIASRKSDRSTKSKEEKPKTVRRNLFPKERTCQTPKKNRSTQPTTPKSKKNNKMKIKFVAETPYHKQKDSKKFFLEQQSPKEIAESPKIIKDAKGDSNKELLKKLRKTSEASLKPTIPSSLQKESCSYKFTQYTPESKRRLSLKLFSKLLSSPTARMGIKKCTKRLFDQVSPHKSGESAKKFKPMEESKLSATPGKK